ncbi:MAG TPA: ATP-dependent RNA helicase, partial [Pantoea sp.]|nr:ATP-dependent RNA helicase [Pantoea sp.]
LESSDLDQYRALLEKLSPQDELDMETLAAALLKMAQGERPLIVQPDAPRPQRREFRDRDDRRDDRRSPREARDNREGGDRPRR